MDRLTNLFRNRFNLRLIGFAFLASFSLGSSAFALKPASAHPSPTAPAFEKRQIHIAGKTITVEIADSDAKRERGLMFRKSLAPDTGMLFIFEGEQPLSFWMMNTLIPLSIGYFDAEKKLVDTQEMVPAVLGEARPKTYPSARPAMYALEMPKDWFKQNGIKSGTAFTFVGK